MKNVTWDENKAHSNMGKHGVSFEEAVTVVINPLSFINLNDHPEGNRYEYIGYSIKSRILFVITAEEPDYAVHIISARKATRHEREKHEKGV